MRRAMNETAEDPRVGKLLSGKWKLDRLLGEGGMATVYAATHRNGATAAIKILHPEFARRVEARARFLREAYIANKAGKGAVAVLDDDVDDDGSPYLVMELLRGEPVDLRAKREGGRLPVDQVLWIACQTLATLETAHAAGIVHRDLKPENLFWTADDRIKVLDFGIARLRDATNTEATRTGMIMGTPSFMAPEQAVGSMSEIDPRTDIWSVGAIMFNLLTGHDVHEGGGNPVVTAATRHARSITSVDPDLPAPVARIVDRALAFKRNGRYPTARAMREDIEALETGEEPVIPSVRIPPARVPSIEQPPPSTPPAASSRRGFATQMSVVDAAALREWLGLVEAALLARREHGAASPKSIRTCDAAYRHAWNALSTAHIGLFWNVRPDGFYARRDELLWQSRAPLPPTPQRMHESGLRMLGVLPGLTKDEFEVILRALGGDIAPFADYATLLQSSGFEHVVYRIDPRKPDTPAQSSSTLDSPSSGGVTVAAMLRELTESPDPAVRAAILSRLERRADGHEAEIARAATNAAPPLAMGLLRVLGTLDSDAAREAMLAATKSPHSIVRIDALSRLEAGGERIRGEVRLALEDADPRARVEILAAIEAYKIKAAGPALALRVRSRAFDALPLDERRLALGTLGALMPSRAEAIAIELLQDQRLISSDAHEATRELAAELLGRIGTSREAREALALAAKERWRTSSRVRAACTNAVVTFEARAKQRGPSLRPRPRPSRRPPSKPPSSKRPRGSKRPASPSKRPSKRPPPTSSKRPPGRKR